MLLRLQDGSAVLHSGISILRFSIRIGRDEPFGAKRRDACIPKGSPQNLIYPYISKLTSFVIKQFFALGKVHQTLMRSRLRRFLMLGASHLDYRNFDSRFALPQDDQVGTMLLF